jgi:hypothetical protein
MISREESNIPNILFISLNQTNTFYGSIINRTRHNVVMVALHWIGSNEEV